MPDAPLTDINEPSNITDFDGFVAFTRIRGSGIGTNTNTGKTQNLAFQADMGFNQGRSLAPTAGVTRARLLSFDSTCTPVQSDRPISRNRFTTTTRISMQTTSSGSSRLHMTP